MILLYFANGITNNIGYVLINTSGQDLAAKFHQKDLMGAFQLYSHHLPIRSLTLFSVAVRVVNSKYLLKYKHLSKIYLVSLVWFFGYSLFFLSFHIKKEIIGFYCCLLATLLIGIFNSLGGITSVGFMKAFPADIVVGFSSGTGFAGVAGVGIIMFSKRLGIPFDLVV